MVTKIKFFIDRPFASVFVLAAESFMSQHQNVGQAAGLSARTPTNDQHIQSGWSLMKHFDLSFRRRFFSQECKPPTRGSLEYGYFDSTAGNNVLAISSLWTF